MLDHPCDCAMFRVGMMAVDAGRASRQMVAAIAAEMEANRDELCRLDGVIGDADHGIAMALGFARRGTPWRRWSRVAEPTAVLNTAAKAFLNAVGASCGPLYATALMRAGAAVKGKAALDDADVVALLQAMATGIRDRGKAEPGRQDHARRLGAGGAGGGRAQARRRRALAACLDAAAAAARDGRRGDPRHGRGQGAGRAPWRAGARPCRSGRRVVVTSRSAGADFGAADRPWQRR